MLRRIFGPKWEEVMGGWKKLHNEELHNLYALQNIIMAIKSRRMRCMGHIARMEELRNAGSNLVGKPKRKGQWEDLGVDGMIILELILGKLSGEL
jgi:hypothetical protein